MGANFSSEPVVEKHTERDKNDTFTVAVSSCQGWRMSQEDEHSLIIELPGEHKASFFAVFDGHGSGRVSKHASEALWRHITQNENYIKGNFREALEESFLSFDREVDESYNAHLAGTTAICVLIVDNVIYCANIGDSRAVASINCECLPLSQDHKPENPLELKRILAAGGYVLGNRVNGNLALSRAFGDFHYKSNKELPAEQQIVCPCPDIKRIELNDDVDFIVLACDGIWDVLSSEEVVNFVISRLEQNVEPGLICEQLTTRCIATDYELVIGCDNMTVLLICHTRGRNWEDYCTDIFEKHSKKLGVTRTRTFDDNFDNTFQRQDDRFLRSGSSSEHSRDTSLDKTFSANETSTDSDTSSQGTRVHDPVRELFDMVFASSGGFEKATAYLNARNETSTSEETPQITEVVAEDQPSSSDAKPVANEDQESKNELPKEQSESTSAGTEGNQGANKENASDEIQSSGTTEILLSAPDEREESPDDQPEPDLGTSDQAVSTAGVDREASEQVQNTIEIQLGVPDESGVTDEYVPDPDDLPEVVEEEQQQPEAQEGQAEESGSQAQDVGADAQNEADEES